MYIVMIKIHIISATFVCFGKYLSETTKLCVNIFFRQYFSYAQSSIYERYQSAAEGIIFNILPVDYKNQLIAVIKTVGGTPLFELRKNLVFP